MNALAHWVENSPEELLLRRQILPNSTIAADLKLVIERNRERREKNRKAALARYYRLKK